MRLQVMSAKTAQAPRAARKGIFRRLARWQLQVLIVLVALLIGLRVALPRIVKSYVNKTLDEMPEYAVSIGDVDIACGGGLITIHECGYHQD